METEKEKRDIAMARFALIAPVINGTYTEPSASAYYRRIAESPFVFPDNTTRSYRARTYEDWVRKYKNSGFEGLVPKGRTDKGCHRKLSEDTKAAIYVLKERYPKINATVIYEKMIEDKVIDKSEVSLSTIQRFVKKAFSSDGANPGNKDRRSFEAERICGLWQADSLYGPYVGDPKQRAYLQMIIDDKSRMVMAARFYQADNALNFQATLKSAINACGIPEKCYVDNGAPYKNEQLSLICGSLGVVLLHAPVRDGAAKGYVKSSLT